MIKMSKNNTSKQLIKILLNPLTPITIGIIILITTISIITINYYKSTIEFIYIFTIEYIPLITTLITIIIESTYEEKLSIKILIYITTLYTTTNYYLFYKPTPKLLKITNPSIYLTLIPTLIPITLTITTKIIKNNQKNQNK